MHIQKGIILEELALTGIVFNSGIVTNRPSDFFLTSLLLEIAS